MTAETTGGAFVRVLDQYADRAHDNFSYRALLPEHVLRDAAAVIREYHERETRHGLASRFWVHYRCGWVGCEIVEQHEHGGGHPMREMTPEEQEAARHAAAPAARPEPESPLARKALKP